MTKDAHSAKRLMFSEDCKGFLESFHIDNKVIGSFITLR